MDFCCHKIFQKYRIGNKFFFWLKQNKKCVACPQEDFLFKFIIRLLDGSEGATRRNLQNRPKILKNILEHQINQSERNPPKENYA
jgi:hypothetical protein